MMVIVIVEVVVVVVVVAVKVAEVVEYLVKAKPSPVIGYKF